MRCRVAVPGLLALLGLLGFAAAGAFAQSGDGNVLSFSLERTGARPLRYTVRVSEASGRGTFHSDVTDPTATGSAEPAQDQAISVEPAILKKMFAAVPLVKSNRCDAHNKSVAQTGAKTLRYSSAAGTFQCTYNYGLDDRVNTATAAFEGVAETMEYGERLTTKLRFDRLGLDAEMDSLQSALSEGRALDVKNISPVLQAIQADERVMERVRRKAEHLLAVANGTAPQSSLAGDSNER